ncbi:DUF1707 SHOCT-like domain-containing protein [Nocardiopsis listeri]|uniref:DUF1707 SHOCT-like domain-containing protein n=1 Tax=Nocardiopsis listeri TaxID=53440 RepID=UPI00082AE572|nr:DUF1707 domain-containing protein [Nocardiopsis listeri]
MPKNVPEQRQLASDKEREDTATSLRTAFEEGRLDQEEHERRVGIALSAKTHGELRTLLDDLPANTERTEKGIVSAQGKPGMSPLAVWGIFAAVTFVVWAVPALIMGYPMGLLGWAAFCGFWGIPAFVVTATRRRK